MKYLTFKNVKSLLLFVICLILSSCIDACTDNSQTPEKKIKEKADSTIIATIQLTDATLGYRIKE